jgi:hypothetical protein
MASHRDGEEGGWIEPRRRAGSAADPRGLSTDLVKALDESLQIAESSTHDSEQVPQQPTPKPRARRAGVPRFPRDPREALIRRALAVAGLAAAALAVGWLVARLFGG